MGLHVLEHHRGEEIIFANDLTGVFLCLVKVCIHVLHFTALVMAIITYKH